VVDYVSQLPFADSKNINLVATSMGGYIVSSLPSIYKKVKRMILIDTSILPKDSEGRKYSDLSVKDIVPNEKVLLNKTRPVESLKEYKGEVFVVSCTGDNYIPEYMGKALYNAAVNAERREKLELADVKHAVFKYPERRQKLMELLDNLLPDDDSVVR